MAADRREILERQYPERFSDGEEWVRLANEAMQQPTIRRFSQEEWRSIVPESTVFAPFGLYATGSWVLRQRYEDLRMQGKYLSREGERRVRERLREIALSWRSCRTPECVGRHRIAWEILQAAMTHPERRPDFLQVVKRADLIVRAVQPLRRPRR